MADRAERGRGAHLRRALAVSGSGLLVAAAVAVAPQAQAVEVGSSREATELAMVRFEPGTSAAEIQASVAAAGGTVLDSPLAALGVAVVRPTSGDFAGRVDDDDDVRATWRPTLVGYGRPERKPKNGGEWPPPWSPPEEQPAFPDPFHRKSHFAGETNPRGVLQWDDLANGAVGAWPTTRGEGVRVAVVDTGVEASHRELAGRVEATYNMLPCDELEQAFGAEFDRQRDCEMADGDGHGTWVASRLAGATNQFASNGIAPEVTIVGYKALSTSLGGGATAWVASAMVHACTDGGVDLVNLSLGGYNDPTDPDAIQDYLLWVDVVAFCRKRGVGVLASAGNSHVRVDRLDLEVGGRFLSGVGQVANDDEGWGVGRSTDPGEPQPGFLEVPAGVPGVLMVSATNNATAPPTDDVPAHLRPPAEAQGRLDQLAYYSNYGSRVDLAAPGGARKFNLPRADGGPGNVLYGGWGVLGALVADGQACQESGGPEDFACFQLGGETFGWFQGSSMSSPNAAGVAALLLAARPDLRGRPDALAGHLAATARTDLDNATPRLDPYDGSPAYGGEPCETGYCHLDWEAPPVGFAEAYGAGMVDATAAVAGGWW